MAFVLKYTKKTTAVTFGQKVEVPNDISCCTQSKHTK